MLLLCSDIRVFNDNNVLFIEALKSSHNEFVFKVNRSVIDQFSASVCFNSECRKRLAKANVSSGVSMFALYHQCL